jgi:hypothetical protein
MKPYGQQLDTLRENWSKNTQLMEANATSFAQSFMSSFSTAFGPLSGGDSTLKSITDSLGSADPEKWKQIGDEWGRWAGTSLAPVIADLQGIAVGLKEIMDVLPGIKTAWDWTAGWAIKGYSRAATEALPIVKADKAAMDALQPMEARQASPLARALPEGEALLARMLEWFKSASGGQGPGGAAPALNVDLKPDIHIQIGNETIADIAVKAVEDKTKSEYAASRRGFGEAW